MAVIKLNIIKEEDLYEKYSFNVNELLIDYLIKEAMLKNNITIEVKSLINVENLDIIIKNGINACYDNLKVKDKFYDAKQIFNTLCGIILLAISQIIKINLLEELLLIAGWVAIWDAIEYTFNKNIERNKTKKTLQKLMQAKIIVKQG